MDISSILKNIIDKKVDVIEIDNYIEVNVTYEIIENTEKNEEKLKIMKQELNNFFL